jgi:hypothetical protein
MSKKPTLIQEPDDFHLRRRQQFLYKKMYENIREEQVFAVEHYRKNTQEYLSLPEYGLGSKGHVGSQGFTYHHAFWLWMLDYTAGEDLEVLAPRLTDVVDEFVKWHEANKPFMVMLHQKYGGPETPDGSPVFFDEQVWYQDALQLVSVAVILRDSRSVRRIVKAMSSNRGQDGLYEQIISTYVDDPMESFNETVNGEPYDDLLEAFLEPDTAKALEWVELYLKTWYKAQKEARWYNAHLKIENDKAWYYGYWAFEAGAACYLLDLDDSGIDHLVYPKHLVAYGRKLRDEDRWTSTDDEPLEYDAGQRGRCEAGQPCPREGFWFTPAQAGSRRYFKAGEVMPEVKSDYGATIWQWDSNQSPPTL